MSLTQSPPAKQPRPRDGWFRRLWRRGPTTKADDHDPTHTNDPIHEAPQRRGGLAEMTQSLIAQGRYAIVLHRDAADVIDDPLANQAWAVLKRQMAIVPAGPIVLTNAHGDEEAIELPGYFLDRYAVTNKRFAEFVKAGGYDDLDLWPDAALAALPHLTDAEGRPGPGNWHNGRCEPGLEDHPVTGICWFEAYVYAQWVGKTLPSAALWQKAAGWPDRPGQAARPRRYPWGDALEIRRANLWAAGIGQTVPVDQFSEGCTPNGIYQMVGNVWHWLDDPLSYIVSAPEESLYLPCPMRRIIGGAFDTYLNTEVTNTFITGQAETDRRTNLGFRCALPLDLLRSWPPRQEGEQTP